MINELHELALSLEHHGLLKSMTNPNVGKVGKCPCLLIELNQAGEPASMQLLRKEETAQLWKHSKGNHNSFPAIRIQEPLLDPIECNKANGDIWKKDTLIKKQNSLLGLNYSHDNPHNTDIIISKWSINELSPVISCQQKKLEALKRLLERFPQNSAQCKQFYASLLNLIYCEISRCNNIIMIDFLKDLLIGNYDKKKQKFIAGCMTYFDIYETNEVPCKVVSSDTQKELIDLLNQPVSNKNKYEVKSELCALSGRPEDIIKDKFPNPNLPLIGLTYLFSKKADIPCLTRYSMSGVGAFHISRSAAASMNDALAFLTMASRENKSWRAIVDTNQDKNNLLMAYLIDDPQNDALLAQILDDPEDFSEKEDAFDALCQQVLGNMNNILGKNPSSRINLMILEALDPGRKQIVYSNTFSAEQLRNGLLSWSEASKNHPDIFIHILDNKKDEYQPICIGPSKIYKLLKLDYSPSKKAKTKTPSAVSFNDIYRLYIPKTNSDINDIAFFQEILYKVLRKTNTMLGDIGQRMTLEFKLKSVESQEAENACIAISLVSILLFRIGIRKEEYMLDVAFNIGQLLQLTDKLHKQYCIQVRNGGDDKKPLPTQLIGNSLLPIVSENPNEALTRLSERIRIYLAWANTISGEGSRLAKWILARYGEVCSKIAGKEIPETFNTAQQAQVLLGYLAIIPYEKKEGEKDHE